MNPLLESKERLNLNTSTNNLKTSTTKLNQTPSKNNDRSSTSKNILMVSRDKTNAII